MASRVDQFLTKDGLTTTAKVIAPGQTHQQSTHEDTYPHTHDIPMTKNIPAITAGIRNFNEFSLVVDNRPPFPPRQESLPSIASWHSTTPTSNPVFRDGIPLPSQTANNTMWDTSCLANNTE